MNRWVILRSVYKPFLSLKFGCHDFLQLRYSRQHPESWGLPRHFQRNSCLSTVLQNAAVHLDVSAFPQCLMKTHIDNPPGCFEPTAGRDIGGKNRQKFCFKKL